MASARGIYFVGPLLRRRITMFWDRKDMGRENDEKRCEILEKLVRKISRSALSIEQRPKFSSLY